VQRSTGDGQPDLQGTWGTFDSTPFEPTEEALSRFGNPVNRRQPRPVLQDLRVLGHEGNLAMRNAMRARAAPASAPKRRHEI
jgi:hypothetical protein